MPVSYSKQYTRAISLNLEHQRRLNLQREFIDNIKKHKRADLNSHYHEIKAQLYNIRAKTPSVPDNFEFSSDDEEEDYSIQSDDDKTVLEDITKTDGSEENKINDNNDDIDVKENTNQDTKQKDIAPIEITPSATNTARKSFGKRVSVIEPDKNENADEKEEADQVEKEDDVDDIVNQFSLDYLLPLSSRNPKPPKSKRLQEVRSAEPKSPRNPFLKLDPITARRMIEVQTIQRKLYNLHAKRHNAKKVNQARSQVPNSPLWARGFTGKSDYTESTQGISRAKSAASLSRPPSVIRISPNRPYVATRSAKGVLSSNFIVNAQYYDA